MLASPPHSPVRSSPPLINMKSINIDDFPGKPEEEAIVRKIAQAVCSGRRIIVITGAGISVSSGIPDFRSAGGLYERLGLKFGGSGVQNNKGLAIKGKDFFDASFFHSETTRPLFYKFIAELKEMCNEAEPTPTHRFLKELVLEKRVLRWYTQNVDGLEERMGLETSVTHSLLQAGQGNKGISTPPVVGLHGTLAKLSCTVCKTSIQYEQHETLKAGSTPSCGACTDRIKDRVERGLRKTRPGILRPDIVLYNEPHPQGDLIASALSSDLAKRPTLLLVIGTSLRVVGLKRMIKDVARAVHGNGPDGMVLYLNKTGVQAKSEWRGVFDYELVGECDRWVEHFRQESKKKSAPEKAVEPIVILDESPVKTALTPVRPPAKAKRIDAFFKHVKSSTSALPTAKGKENKELKQPQSARPSVIPAPRSRRDRGVVPAK